VTKGLVLKATGNIFTVKDQQGKCIECRIKGNLKVKGLKSTNPVSVGDIVYFTSNKIDSFGTITKIGDRKNYVIRRSTNLSKKYHIIASNVDQAVLIVTLIEPETNIDFIDRYLISTESFRINTLIIFNKLDLYVGEVYKKYEVLFKTYTDIGYKCLATSTITGTNISEFAKLLVNKISVINGNSGVGKSALIHSISPNLKIKVGDISDFHKTGMHTTSYSEMYELQNNTYIIDTPGIKGFGLINFYKEELYHYFPEIFKLSADCRFYNCTHTHEPGCRVIDAVNSKLIALSRYSSYINIFNDKDKKYRY
jgi:ribosome biogenesis GTPase / thiamine phosphate phosphatase